MSNIQTFNVRSVAATPKIDNVSAGKNLVNINLTNANLHHQEANKGAFDGNVDLGLRVVEEVREYSLEELMAFDEEINTNLSESGLKDKSLDEILKEGQETHEEVILARNQAVAQKAIDAIDDIGKVDLNSKDEIENAIAAYNSLTPEQKALVPSEKLDELKKAQNEFNKKQIEEAERKRKEKEKELEALYKARDDNNGLFHPKKEKAIESEIAKLEAELGVPHKPDGWESFCDTVEDVGATVATFTVSTIEGIVDVGETIVDGAVQVVGGSVACVVGLVDEEAGDAMKKGIQDFVSYDASGAMYDAWVDMSGIDPEIAYGWAHTAGNITGQVVGYAAISMIPGGAAVTATAGGLAAAGASAESAYANGATFEEAMVVSTVAGVAGAVSGGAANKLKGAAAGAKTITQVAGYTSAGAAVGAAEPIVNSGVEYLTYGNNDGKSYIEFMNESGGWLKIGMGATSGAISTGSEAYKGYKDPSYEAKMYDELYKKANAKKQEKWKKQNPNDPRTPLSSALTEDGKVWNPKGNGYVLDADGNPICQPATLKSGSTIDRYGSEGGCYIGLEDADGNLASYPQRSLAYTEESNTMYNKYRVKSDISTDTLTQKFNASNPETQQNILKYMSDNGIKPTFDSNGNFVLPVNSGVIAPCYGCPGGGMQSDLPVSINQLEEWVLIEKIN